MLEFQSLTEKVFKSKILELIENEEYSKNAQKISQLFRDNPVDPMENAMYWIEYVIRTKGAKHLKSAAIKLNWFQYLCFDVIGPFLAAGLFVVWALWSILKKVCRKSKVVKSSQAKKIN